MLPLLLVAVSVGFSNLAAAIGIGVAGVGGRTRLRVGLVFGLFEGGMPIVGLIIGQHVAGQLGHATHWTGGGLLVAVGAYALVQSVRDGPGRLPPAPADLAGVASAPAAVTAPMGSVRLLLSGFALSLDNLVVGFALGTFNVGILLGAVVIGAVSVAMSLAGLELGARIGRLESRRGEQIGGVVLISVGVAIAAGFA